MTRPPPNTIAEVLTRLDEVVDTAKKEQRAGGYFAALYRRVTREVARGIDQGHFDDGPRMEKLDVVFASRYLSAYDAYRSNEPVTRSWRLAFEAEDHWWPLVLQHLLLGINAHINLDLGIAAASVAPGDSLRDLKPDFDRINGILASLIDDVGDRLARIWPLLRYLDIGADRLDENAIDFSIQRARDHAWTVACKLAPLPQGAWEPVIDLLDNGVSLFGGKVRSPGLWLSTRLRIVRIGERGSVAEKIAILE